MSELLHCSNKVNDKIRKSKMRAYRSSCYACVGLPPCNIITFNSIMPASCLSCSKIKRIKAVQFTNKDYNMTSRNSTQGLEACMEQIGKAISLYTKCDGYLLC